jgi:hypothetical protein
MAISTHETIRTLDPEQNLQFTGLAAQLGGLAIEQPQPSEETSISPLQANVISGLAGGDTPNQISRHLGVPPQIIKDTKKDMTRQFSSVSVGVDFAITKGVVEFKLQPNPDITAQLTALDLGMLQAYAKGGISSYLKNISSGHNETAKDCEKQLLEKIEAQNRPHAVKRSYELGVFSINKGEQL